MQAIKVLDRVESSIAEEIPHPKDPTQTKIRHVAVKASQVGATYSCPDELAERLIRLGLGEPSTETAIPLERLG